jgi:putative pyruvate formate lyase activating enzyme
MNIRRRDFIKHTLLAGGSLIFYPGPAVVFARKDAPWIPAYAKLEKAGLLAERVEQAYSIFEQCRLCPRECGVNRFDGEKGFCRAPRKVMVYVAQPHFGEEVSLVGQHGSGTIFFSNCNLRCVFCQNWPISIRGEGSEMEDEDLAQRMLFLQKIGCHNINLVTPTHVMPNILNATRIACKKGLRIPLVYNTSGYERVEIIKMLDGIVDIYLPDIKYMDGEMAAKYSSDARDYPAMATAAVLEMNWQVGSHQVDRRGVARRGLMIRHLVMPNRVAGTKKFVQWVAENLPQPTYVNIMAQYHVDYKAFEHPEIARGITVQEFLEAMHWAETYGLSDLDPRSVRIRDFYTKSEQSTARKVPPNKR